jgi:hypothetical protein
LAQLVSRLNQAVIEMRLPVGAVLEMAPAIAIKLDGVTLGEAISSVRDEIAKLQQETLAVRSAPLKRTSQQAAIGDYLLRLALRTRPKIGFDIRGNARVSFAEDMVTGKDDILGMMAFVFPDAVAAAFARDDDEQAEAPNALSPQERDKRLSELAAALLVLERREETLIARAADDGMDMLRRVDASPLAVLGVVIAMQAQQVA